MVMYIAKCGRLDGQDWFIGPGWYYTDETNCFRWGGDTEAEALAVYNAYIQTI